MMKKKLTAIIVMAVLATTALGQSVSKQINDVKRDSHYLSAEATLESEEDAYKLAEELLTKQISEYVAEQKTLKKAPNVIVKDVAGKAERIKMNRGTMVRVFLYVKKNDILAADNTRILIQPANQTPQKQTEPKSKVEPLDDQGAAEAEPVLSEVPGKSAGVETPASVTWQQDVINRLLGCENVAKAQNMLRRLQSEMKIKRYGTPDTCRNQEKCCWLVFEDDGHIITILGPGKDERTNYKTNEADSLSNYSGKGAIWLMLAN